MAKLVLCVWYAATHLIGGLIVGMAFVFLIALGTGESPAEIAEAQRVIQAISLGFPIFGMVAGIAKGLRA